MLLPLLTLCLALISCEALYNGPFVSSNWEFTSDISGRENQLVKFIVALKLRNADKMHSHFLSVSDPKSPMYGKFLSPQEMQDIYGPDPSGKKAVLNYFKQMPDAQLNIGEHGDLLEVVAHVKHVENLFSTKLGWVQDPSFNNKAIRSKSDLIVPDEISQHIDFISLNSPVTHIRPSAASLVKTEQEAAKAYSVSVVGGNEEALVRFTPTCGNGEKNYVNPPCTNVDITQLPEFTFAVNEYTNTDSTTDYLLNTDATVFTVPFTKVYCYNSFTVQACSQLSDQVNCTCMTKLSPLPKYTQLSVNITSTFPQSTNPTKIYDVGASKRFALTDVATANFLSDLYHMPKGLRVNHGSNQSVAEFYHEFYSNKDLTQFLRLSGLPNASIPTQNVFGDLPNNQSHPGGEAQLDVEYIMALAPGADTFFYSLKDYNPNDPVDDPSNEGFLSYLQIVDSQAYPPLVHSLSYGDVESQIFNASHNGSVQYATRCDQEFMQMGLRGLTLVFSSGDDGIGNFIIRKDKATACSKAHPSWPAGSPYVTSVGGTQLTDKYLPVCGLPYAPSDTFASLPTVNQLTAECHGVGETVCTSTFGGVITSGGGFSTVYNRAQYAPWQQTVVDYYLRNSDASAYPPTDYFNAAGRGYPDVATYASNYFIYLDGKITRESGTSASAPVFAAMVTLWNDIRLANNQAPMGFIAPFLYNVYAQNPDAFNDVVTGNNACGVGSSIDTAPCCQYSFSAVPGWDAVTGLGSPNFEVISNLVINQNSEFPSLAAYPNGVSQTVYSDDSTTKEKSDVSFILSIVAIAVAALAIVLGIYLLFVRSKGVEGSANNAEHKEAVQSPFATA